MLRLLALIFSALAMAGIAHAQSGSSAAPVSRCQAIAQGLPQVVFTRFSPVAVEDKPVKIRYLGHSTFFLETPGGVTIATDYNGWYRPPVTPVVVTMNKAHSTHYTLTPDPAIRHVLHGWSDMPGEKADHDVVVGDTYIRNVTTDIRAFGSGAMEHDGNSIFIFETAGLCIGHLGHLHHELTDAHYAEIGRLDILMVPVDGGLTTGLDSMSRVVKRLNASLVLPMHRPGLLEPFLSMFDGRFDVARSGTDVITVSLNSLPKRPLILVPRGF